MGLGADIFVVFPAGAAQPRVFVGHNRVAVSAKFSSGVRSAIPLSDIKTPVSRESSCGRRAAHPGSWCRKLPSHA